MRYLSTSVIVLLATATVFFASISFLYYRKNVNLTTELSSVELKLSISESNLAVQTKALNQAVKAGSVLQSHLDRATANADYWQKKASDLSTKEGANEILSPYERAVLDSLRDQ